MFIFVGIGEEISFLVIFVYIYLIFDVAGFGWEDFGSVVSVCFVVDGFIFSLFW